MAIKYIQKNKNGLWAISNSKAGKALRTTNTQKEAIAIAGSQKTTEGIMIKRASGWTQATGWDTQIANSTKSITTLKKEKAVPVKKTDVVKISITKTNVKETPIKKGTKTPATKKAVSKKPMTKTPVTKKATTKKSVTKKEAAKAPVAKKAVAKVVEVSKPNIIKKGEAKKEEKLDVVTTKPKKGINGYLGLLIGLSIIAVVVGGAFLLGHFL